MPSSCAIRDYRAVDRSGDVLRLGDQLFDLALDFIVLRQRRRMHQLHRRNATVALEDDEIVAL